ncbi:MAG: carbon-nitrogen family hydrolase [Acidobacteriota bacterium]
MKIAALQTDIVWEDPQANFERLRPWIRTAAVAGARLLVLPEMYAVGFSMATHRISEPAGGPSTRFLQEEAERHGLWIAGSIPELPDLPEPSETGASAASEPDARPFNTLVFAGPQGELHRYRKIHPFTFAGEDRHYQAGTAFTQLEIEGLRITPFICYDLRFADEFWANAAATDLYVVVANWPETRRHHWMTLLLARAIENQAYVVGVNRVGDGGKLHYTGDSRIIDPMGEVLAAGAEQETLLLADVDAGLVRATRQALPFLPDRR